MLIVKNIKAGQVFLIENTPTYPKIKTEKGYVDIRDNIVNNSGNCNGKTAEIMSLELLAKNYEGTTDEIIEWIIRQTGIKPNQ